MRRRTSRNISILVAGAFASVALLSFSGPVSAVELTDVTATVTVTPTSLDPGDRIRTDVDFCVPDSAAAGDTFSLSLPEQLSQLPSSIDLNDPTGALVAVATITGVPAVATFELTTYVDERVDVCGTAFFESQLSESVTPVSVQTLSFVLSGGATFDTDVTVGEPEVGVGRDTARKSATFEDSGDQCRTSLDSCLSWFIESRPGPFASVTIADDGLVDAAFECSTLSVRLWTLNPDGSRDAAVLPGDVGASITQSCTANSLDVTVTGVPDGVIVRSLVSATPTAPDAGGDVTFQNVASVTHVDAQETETTDAINGRVRSSSAGGAASGVVPTTTTTTTTTTAPTTTAPTTTAPTTTAPTTTAPTTTAPTTTTTVVGGSGSATTTTTTTTTTLAPILPATGGSEGSLIVIAFASALAGAAMIAASRRRPST